MNDDQLQNHLKENVVSHQLILLKMFRAGASQHNDENVATQQEALKQSLTTAEATITGHDWALHSQNQRLTSLERDMEVHVLS